MIAAVDEFILLDDVQYTAHDWRNRNRIKTPQGPKWLTVPVGSSISREIRDVVIHDRGWKLKHWKTLEACYGRAAHFSEIARHLGAAFLDQEHTHLSALNRDLITLICTYLGVDTKIKWSWEYQAQGARTERIIRLCQAAGASVYVSGPAARAYLDEVAMAENGIAVTWFDYSGYPEYPQLWGAFEGQVSVLDLLFNCGPSAPIYMKHVRQ